MWSIRILTGPQAGKIYELKRGKNIFGRGTHCDVQVMSVGISKEHCEIHVYKNKVMIIDLKSSNGTFVNGVKVQNALIKLGSKLSLFDIIMDVIPTAQQKTQTDETNKVIKLNHSLVTKNYQPSLPNITSGSNALQIAENQIATTYPQLQMADNLNPVTNIEENVSSFNPLAENEVSLNKKINDYIENVAMGMLYSMCAIFPFKHILLGFILTFSIIVTTLSLFPLSTIIQESNFIEASKRAKTIARTLAILNETALSTDQFSQLNVSEAQKEEGITEALIISQLDGSIIAPTEIVGREASRPMFSQIRKEQKSMVLRVDSKTIGASQPIGAYDLNTGEVKVKYHAVVFYDVSSLNVDDGRFISLFMQTLSISALFGLVLYFIFSKLIQYPLNQLNKQVDQALKDKLDRTEIYFDYPAFQKVVSNVNLMLSRITQNQSNEQNSNFGYSKDIEFNKMVDLIQQPTIIINNNKTIIAVNAAFEDISQMHKDSVLQKNYDVITDAALMQNIDALVSKSIEFPHQKHFDRIPFSQFECEINIQAFLSDQALPEYFILTLNKIATG